MQGSCLAPGTPRCAWTAWRCPRRGWSACSLQHFSIAFAFFGIWVVLTLVSADLAGQVNILWIVALILPALGNIVHQFAIMC